MGFSLSHFFVAGEDLPTEVVCVWNHHSLHLFHPKYLSGCVLLRMCGLVFYISILSRLYYLWCGRLRMISLFPALFFTCPRHVWHSGYIIRGRRRRPPIDRRWYPSTLLVSVLALNVQMLLLLFFPSSYPRRLLLLSTQTSGVGAERASADALDAI